MDKVDINNVCDCLLALPSRPLSMSRLEITNGFVLCLMTSETLL